MNKSLRKELLREIRQSRNRFLSILIMVALGVLFLVGLRSAAPDMRATADRYFDETRLFDVEILTNMGLTDAEMEIIQNTPGVEAAEGGWSLDALAAMGETERVVKVIDLSDTLNLPVVVEGKLPKKDNQCALDTRLADALGAKVGDRISLDTGDALVQSLSQENYRVTALLESPLYLSLDRGTSTLGDGSVTGFVMLPRESFLLDYYTVAYLLAEDAVSEDAYSQAYSRRMEDLTERLKGSLEPRTEIRLQQVQTDTRSRLRDAQQELDEGWEDAQQEIRRAERKLQRGKKDLDQGNADFLQGQKDYYQEIRDGRQALEDGREWLDEGWETLEDGKQQLEEGKAWGTAQLEAARKELDDGQAQLDAAARQLLQGQRELNRQKEAAQGQMNSNLRDMAAAELELGARRTALQLAETAADAARDAAEDYERALDQQNAALGIGLLSQGTLEELQAAADQADSRVSEAREAYHAAQAEMDRLDAAYQEGLKALNDAQAQINDGWAQYNAGQETLQQGERQYAQGLQEYQKQVRDAQKLIDDGEKALNDGEKQYTQGQEDLEQGIIDGRQALLDARQSLREGASAYAKGAVELVQAKREAEDRRAEAQDAIDRAGRQLDRLKTGELYVLDRNSNYGFVSYDQNATRMENLARVFPLIFYIVAALVCLTTMTRMVEEERTQIGAIKALGYGAGSIAAKFLLYGITAALLGTVLGILTGATVIPWVIFTSYNIMYNLHKLHLSIYWGLCLAAGAVGIACTAGATLWAVLATARQTPAALMRPKAPRAGKRIFLEHIGPLWRHMRFSMKVSARNLFRYKKRLWMTVIGVAGCTALLIAGLGLRTSIFDILDIQFGEIYRYDVQAALDTDVEDVQQRVLEFLETQPNLEAVAGANTRSVTFEAGSISEDGYLTVTDDPAALSTQICHRDMDTKEPLPWPEDGVLVDIKLAERLDLQVGDQLTIDCGQRITVPVRGIKEHYVYHYVYMDASLYTALTGEEYVPGEFLMTVKDDSAEALSDLCTELLKLEGVRSASNLPAMAKSFRETMEVVDAAVMIIILSAAALAMVVLYNLTNINITERIRELATIKVLGFFDMEVAMYIYRENFVLTLMGVALGQLFGKYMCTWLVRTIEMENIMFGREARLQNYLLSVAMSLSFAVLVNVMMYFRMKKIDMIQSLKSVE